MKRRLFAAAVVVIAMPLPIGAQVSYDDVAVIVNVNSAASQAIGNYFKTKRNIPTANMIYVSADTVEEIDSTSFDELRAQIEQHLVAHNLVNAINYLVTTKGVPLKVNRGNIGAINSPSSSVESELTLLLGPSSSSIGRSSYVISPYFYQSTHFSRSAYGMYLVTRLDAYSVQEVYALIDRSGPGVAPPSNARFVLDQDPLWYDLRYLNEFMREARDTLERRGKEVVCDSTTTYLTYHQHVLGYTSWGSNDHNASQYTQYAIPHHSYVAGALAETYVSTSGRSFQLPPVHGQSLIADLVHEGVSGAKGYVYEPYSLAMARPSVLFDRYTAGYNLAESYYAASIFVSWMDVVIGDPKTSIAWVNGPLPVQLAGFSGMPIPQSNAIQFQWRTVSEQNNYGFILQRADLGSPHFVDVPNSFVPGHGTTLVPQKYEWLYSSAPRGAAQYRLKQIDLDGTQHFSEPIEAENGMTGTADADVPKRFSLGQNYPYPFNPLTAIEFTVDRGGRATLEVYDVVGRRVATLFDDAAMPGIAYRVRFDGNSLAGGVYFYRLVSGNRTHLKKLTLLR